MAHIASYRIAVALALGGSLPTGHLWSQTLVYPPPASRPIMIDPAGLVASVRSTAPGAPTPSAFVQLLGASRAGADSVLRSAWTEADGWVRLDSLPLGTFVLQVRALGFAGLRLPVLVAPTGRDSIAIALRPRFLRDYDVCAGGPCGPAPSGHLSGRLLCRESDRPLPSGLIVEVRIKEWSAVYQRDQYAVPASGQFVFEHVPFDDWIIGVHNHTIDLTTVRVHHAAPGTANLLIYVPCGG